jgi:hypothetical protein
MVVTTTTVREGSLFTDSSRFARLSENDFVNHFAAEVDLIWARMKYALGASVSAFEEVMGAAAWKSMSFWYLVAQNDEAITPDAERQSGQWLDADDDRDSVEPRS